MSKKKKITKITDAISEKILEIKAILEVLSYTEQASYPTNIMIDIAKKKIVKIFNNVESTRKILKIN